MTSGNTVENLDNKPSTIGEPQSTTQLQDVSSAKASFLRFDWIQRFSHLLMLVSFTILGFTGLPQKFPESPLSQFIAVDMFGGVENMRQVHHVAAFVLMVASMIHILDVLYRIIVLRVPMNMLPLVNDFTQLFQDVRYYLGLRKHRAYYGRYSYIEKAEYFALVWGTLLMGVTGFMMWNPLTTAKIMPGQFIPAAKAAHGAEAILAVLAIFVWHFYHVHLRHFNKSMWSGKLNEEEMSHEHPAELEEVKAGSGWERPPAEVIRKRQRVFWPVGGVLSVVMIAGVVGFISVEDTAPLTTVPRGETAEVFVPLTPTPRPTPAPTATLAVAEGVNPESWKGTYENLFRNRCSTCHGVTSVGGLSLATYEEALKGGKSGPAIVPGDPDASHLVQVQSVGGHPGQLTIDELQSVIDWILNGAPEQ